MDVPINGSVRDGTHWLAVRVYYEDTDTAGIVYYANYLRFIERGRTELLRHAGIDQFHLMAVPVEDRISFAVRQCTLDYLAPAHLDDALQISTQIDKLGAAYIDMLQAVWRDDKKLLGAKVRVAALNHRGLPTRVPPWMIEKFNEILPLNDQTRPD